MTEQTGTARGTKPLEHITVRIIAAGGFLRAVPYTVVVSIAEAEQIKWICQGSDEFQVEFKESPFGLPGFSKENPLSGPPKVAAGSKEYKYTVKAPGHADLDPKVIIVA